LGEFMELGQTLSIPVPKQRIDKKLFLRNPQTLPYHLVYPVPVRNRGEKILLFLVVDADFDSDERRNHGSSVAHSTGDW